MSTKGRRDLASGDSRQRKEHSIQQTTSCPCSMSLCVIYNKLEPLARLPAWVLNAVPDWLSCLAAFLVLFFFWSSFPLSLSLSVSPSQVGWKYPGNLANSPELLGWFVNQLLLVPSDIMTSSDLSEQLQLTMSGFSKRKGKGAVRQGKAAICSSKES